MERESIKRNDLPNGVDHKKTHSDTIDGVVGTGHRQTTDAIVAVAQNLDAHTMVLLGEFVKTAEEVVKSADEF